MPRRTLALFLAFVPVGCGSSDYFHGDFAEGITGKLGEPMPKATAEQQATFQRGLEVAKRRFDLVDGLGPSFNVTFCAACHERPVIGGKAGLYRNFFLTGFLGPDGTFFPGTSAGRSGGVLRMYHYGDELPSRPPVPETTTIIAQRNPIPMFGTGLIAEIPEDVILEHQDPDDEDGDGVSGRANFERGFVGRFGRKAQTASVEGFIRGPLFNHAGITTDTLSDEQRARLPVDSSSRRTSQAAGLTARALSPAQAAVIDEVLTDEDQAPDPELSSQALFDLISFSMLLAIAEPEKISDEAERGGELFDEVGCAACHVPRLEGPSGPLPIYSDLLLHDLGPDLADGIQQGLATGAEFRTQPLWNLAAVSPYLHDGRAATVEEAIRWHGGEASGARDRLLALGPAAMADLVVFLRSLGGADQETPGLLPPGAAVLPAGELGGPVAGLDPLGLERFRLGRELFDRDFSLSEGLGAPRFNGDSCRACHFDPILGGAGPRDVNVMRHGIVGANGGFVPPASGTILHKETRLLGNATIAQKEATIFEHRQTPPLFGLGLMAQIPEAEILARADPEDRRSPDGISGRAAYTDDGRFSRFGWKAQVPTIAEFVRDAVSAELGLTVERQEGLTFGRLHDDDDVADPELSRPDAETLAFYLENLGPPPRSRPEDPAAATRGEQLFDELGCAACHVPELPSPAGPVRLYSDLLLHEILPADQLGIEDGTASMREFRTTPLWGLVASRPYWHTGEADTIHEAIELHDGEAAASRDRHRASSAADQAALRHFLESL